ncbi:MAG: LptF/LptG family permease, partial [Candidatus Omnitrophota bacterium]|nr:LptF/LptG family permease [Candidatus Omnitrophota bacterium]
MCILDRYISKSVVSIFLATVFIFCLLYVLIDSAANLDEFISQKITLQILAQYYASFLPIMLAQTVPMAFLIAVLLTYSQLNHHNEVIVLRTSGLNFWNITRPAIALALIVSAFIFYMNEKFVPRAENESRRIKNENFILEVDKKKKKSAKIKNLTFYGLKNRLYYIDNFDPNSFDIEGLTVIGFDDQQNIKEKIVALNGKWTGIAWKAFQCHITTFSQSDDIPTKVRVYPEKLLDIKETPEDFLRQGVNVKAMNIRQLKEYIARFSNSGAQKAINNLLVDLHWKIAYPASNLIIVLTAMPLALLTGRRKAFTFTSLGIAIGIGFLYQVFNSVGLTLGKAEILTPLLSAWM